MKNNDLFRIHQGIKHCGNLKGAKFAYGLAKNSRILLNEIEPIQEAAKPIPEYTDHQKKLKDLLSKESITELDPEEREKKIEEFNNSPEALKIAEDQKKHNEDVNKLADEKVNVKFHMISFDDVPTDISVEQLNLIAELIEDAK